jgi:hypothetical protein
MRLCQPTAAISARRWDTSTLGSKTGNWDYRGAYTYYNTEGKDNWNMQARNGSATFHGGYTSSKLTMDFMYYGSRGMRNMEYGEVLTSSDVRLPALLKLLRWERSARRP